MAARLVSFSPLKPSLGQWFGQADAASLDPLPCPLFPPCCVRTIKISNNKHWKQFHATIQTSICSTITV